MNAPNSIRRVGSFSRPLSRDSEIDFDALPSPPRKSVGSSSRRSSNINGDYSAGPSHLSISTVATGELNYDDMPFDGGGDEYGGGDYSYAQEGDDNEPSTRQGTGLQSRRSSFSHLSANGDDGEEGGEDAQVQARHSKAKGKGKVVNRDQEEDVGMEDDIARGLEEVEEQPIDGEEESPEPPAKKRRASPKPQRKKVQPRLDLSRTFFQNAISSAHPSIYL